MFWIQYWIIIVMRDPIQKAMKSHIKSFSQLKKFDPISKCPLKKLRSQQGTQLASVPCKNRNHNRGPNQQVSPKGIEIIIGDPTSKCPSPKRIEIFWSNPSPSTNIYKYYQKIIFMNIILEKNIYYQKMSLSDSFPPQ